MGHARTTRTGAHTALRRALACLLAAALALSLGGAPIAYGAAAGDREAPDAASGAVAPDGAGASVTDETEASVAEEVPEAAAAPSEDMHPTEAAPVASAPVRADATAESSAAPAQIVIQAQKAGRLTVTNHWNGPILVSQGGKQDVTVQEGYSSSTTLTVSADEQIVVKESQADVTFRSWYHNVFDGLVSGVPCAIASMPAMSAFTTDDAGTTAGEYFFCGFNGSGSLISLPAGSFDTSGITTVGNRFFYEFNEYGSLAVLAAGSFDTSKITEAGDDFFTSFDSGGSLRALPRSFRLPQVPDAVGKDYCRAMFWGSSLIKGDQSVPLYFAEAASDVFNNTGILPASPGAGTKVYVNGDPDYHQPGVDDTAPAVTGVRVLTPEVNRPGILKVEVDVVEEGSGLSGVSLSFDSGNGTLGFYVGPGTSPSYSGYSGTIAAELPVGEASDVGLYYLTRVSASDNAGNSRSYWDSIFSGGGSTFPFATPTLTVRDEFDYRVTTGANNPTAAKQVAGMPEGAAARLSFGGSYGSTLPKGVFDAIRGRDKTVVAYDGKGIRWVFHGKDVTKASKDVSLGVGVSTVDGAPYGADGQVVRLTFAPNGELPGKATIRLKSDYLYNMGGVSGTLRLYYVEEGEGAETLVEEDAGFDLVFDGTDKWCHFDVTHNSTFLVSSGPLKLRQHKATFDANGGTVSGKARLVRDVRYGAALGKLPAPTRSGYGFLGWYTAKVGGTKAVATTKATKDVTYYARWRANTHTVKLDASGGKVAGKASASVKRTFGSKLGSLPTPVRTGYTFLGWYAAKAGGAKVGVATKVTKDITYWAHWKAKGPVVTLNANGGKVGKAASASVVRSKGAALGRLATPTRTGYTFQGWFTGKAKGTKVAAKTKVTKNVTYYAHWKTKTYVVKLNANGGKVGKASTSSLKKPHNSKLGRLATPMRAGYTFQGWFTAKTKGTKVAASTKVTKAVTLYAHWKRVR